MKRKIAWSVVGLLAVIGLGGLLYSLFGSYDVVLTQSEVQQKVDVKLPHKTVGDVTITSAQVDLSHEKIGLKVDATLEKSKARVAAKADVLGILRYDKQQGHFYFHPEKVQIADVTVNGYRAPAAVWRRVAPELDKVLLTAAEAMLEHIPVYKLPDTFNGKVAKLVIEQVEVKNNSVNAHLTFYRLTYWLIGWVFLIILAIAIGIVLLRNPELLQLAAIVAT